METLQAFRKWQPQEVRKKNTTAYIYCNSYTGTVTCPLIRDDEEYSSENEKHFSEKGELLNVLFCYSPLC